MGKKVKQWMAIAAAAIALGCVGTFSFEPVSNFAPWAASGLLPLCITATICGYLLAFNTVRSNWAMVAASALATLVLGSVWAYIIWKLLGQFAQHISLLDLLVSDPVFYFGIKRGAILIVFSVPCGLLGVKVASALFTDDGQHRQTTRT